MLVGTVKARGRRLRAGLTLAVALWPSAARAHVAPSPDANNHYVKATLLPDGVRVSYTLLFGERPGAAVRKIIDADGDGRIAPAEAAAFGARVAGDITPRVSLVLDGRAARARWRVTDVGLGEPTVAGGSLAVDLVVRAPYPDARAAEHTLLIDDETVLPLAGEAELRVDESPGVRVRESHLGSAQTGVELRFVFSGNPAGPGARAVKVRFAVDPALRPAPSRAPLALALLGIVLVAVALAVWRYRKV